jgi:hypothetical protein
MAGFDAIDHQLLSTGIPMAEQVFCLICGLGLVGAGIGLSRLHAPDWTNDHLTDAELNKINTWSSLQRRSRWFNNRLISLMGIVMIAVGGIPHGRVWIWTWASIFVMLLLCVTLAMLDAVSSLIAYRKALPSTMRSTLGNNSRKE